MAMTPQQRGANDGGSIEVYFEQEAPDGKERNWLPVPGGTFSLYIRAYWGKEAILDGDRVPPVIEQGK